MENEQILNAYALDPGGVISSTGERNVSFRPKEKGRPTVLVLACIEVAGHNRHSPAAAQEISVEDRSTAAAVRAL